MDVLWLFGAVYLGTTILSMCPFFDGVFTPFAVLVMAALALMWLAHRLRFISPGFVPRFTSAESAIFITGCDQTPGFLLAQRCVGRRIHVFAAVEDPQSPIADWLRKHIAFHGHLLRLDPQSDSDAVAAARFVRENLGSRVLVGAVYASYYVPKETDTLDISDLRKGIGICAMGAAKVADAFASLLQEQNSRYVIVADSAGRMAIPSLQSYCMSQTLALQFAEIIRKKLEKRNVSVHVVEQLLGNFKKTQERTYFPRTCPTDGKIILDNTAIGMEYSNLMAMDCMFRACLATNPKARYLASYTDMIMDKIMRYAPSWVRDRAMNYYFQSIPRTNKST